MPMIYYTCEKCEKTVSKMLKKDKITDTVPCDCGGEMERQLSAPTTYSSQVVDNGIQARKTVVMNDVVEKERERLYDDK